MPGRWPFERFCGAKEARIAKHRPRARRGWPAYERELDALRAESGWTYEAEYEATLKELDVLEGRKP